MKNVWEVLISEEITQFIYTALLGPHFTSLLLRMSLTPSARRVTLIWEMHFLLPAVQKGEVDSLSFTVVTLTTLIQNNQYAKVACFGVTCPPPHHCLLSFLPSFSTLLSSLLPLPVFTSVFLCCIFVFFFIISCRCRP